MCQFCPKKGTKSRNYSIKSNLCNLFLKVETKILQLNIEYSIYWEHSVIYFL